MSLWRLSGGGAVRKRGEAVRECRKLQVALGLLLLAAVVALGACDQIRNTYCSQVVPLLNKPCLVPSGSVVLSAVPRG